MTFLQLFDIPVFVVVLISNCITLSLAFSCKGGYREGNKKDIPLITTPQKNIYIYTGVGSGGGGGYVPPTFLIGGGGNGMFVPPTFNPTFICSTCVDR